MDLITSRNHCLDSIDSDTCWVNATSEIPAPPSKYPTRANSRSELHDIIEMIGCLIRNFLVYKKNIKRNLLLLRSIYLRCIKQTQVVLTFP